MRINIVLGLLVAALASTTCDESLAKLARADTESRTDLREHPQEIFETTDAAGRTILCDLPYQRRSGPPAA